ncbi:MAG: glycerophosphodiester phosphodiesterase [Promethearchaeota archaeon]
MKSEFFYIGHRGTRTDSDENTINAFEKAIEYGANYIELDVRKTKDGKLVVMHDSTLDRTTNGSGQLGDFNYNEIKLLRTKLYQNQIPLLSEVLSLLSRKIKFMIELKEDNLRNKIIKIVKQHILIEECIFSGRDLHILKLLKKELPKSRICYNITKAREFTLRDFLKQEKKLIIKPEMISLRSSLVSPDFIKISHKNEILSISWDFLNYENPMNIIKYLINIGIDGILFDNHKNIPKVKEWIGLRRI